MPVEKSTIDGLLVVSWDSREDERGFFRHTYQAGEVDAALGRPLRMRQGNHSRSQAGVLRGFHHEPWDKFIYVASGTAICAVADVRPKSPTFGSVETFLLGDEPGNMKRIFVSRGLANAFYCLTAVDYLNDVSEEFDPSNRGGVAWNDPLLAVDWPDANPILSETDKALPTLKAKFPNHPLFAAAAA